MTVRINGESFTVVDSEKIRSDTHWSFAVEGKASAEYQWAETGQTDPKGRFRMRAEGNQLLLQRPDVKEWGDLITLMTVDWDGKKITVNKELFTSRGYEVERYIVELIERMDAAASHIRYLTLTLAELGVDIPEELVDTLDETLHNPDRVAVGGMIGV